MQLPCRWGRGSNPALCGNMCTMRDTINMAACNNVLCACVLACATMLTMMPHAVQAHVCERIQRHHVSAVLSGQEPVKGCSSLWAQALADAACRLLRCVDPTDRSSHYGQLCCLRMSL